MMPFPHAMPSPPKSTHTHLDSAVAQNRLAVVQPINVVHRMAGHNALELGVFVHVHRLHLRL